jgi:hypothetical protein
MSAWVLGRLLGLDSEAVEYFEAKLLNTPGADLVDAAAPASFIVPAGGIHFLGDLDTLELNGVPQLHSINIDTGDCPTFPVLVDNNGRTVTVARVLQPQNHAIVFSTFSLEQLANTADVDNLMQGVLGWLASPEATSVCPCPAEKGDLNGVGGITSADVALMLNCVFLQVGAGTVDGDCNLCYSDLNCDGGLSASDVALQLSHTFLNTPLPCL